MLLELEVAAGTMAVGWAVRYYCLYVDSQIQELRNEQKAKVSKVDFEEAVERSNRHVLQAHEARINPPRDSTPIAILYKDSNEKTIVGQEVIPLWKRRPKMAFGGRLYTASCNEGNVWVYREDK